MDRDFERVHTVDDWWDGPRSGVADLRGEPHFYRSIFLEAENDWDPDHFELTPIPTIMLAAVLEAWDIWVRFAIARANGSVSPQDSEDYVALPLERSRHAELQRELAKVCAIDPTNRVVMRGEFRPVAPLPAGHVAGVPIALQVRWRAADAARAI